MIWYCMECGYYQFSKPENEGKELPGGILWTCPICQNLSLCDCNNRNVKLQNLVKGFADQFPQGRFVDPRPQYQPINFLIRALIEAKYFIHIAAESIDDFFLGMLAIKLLESPEMEIRVIVWHPQKIYQHLERLWDSSVIMKGFKNRERPFWIRGIILETIPEAHSKLIVVDGYIVFKGSANATLAGWSRGDKEIIEFSKNRPEIVDLNNQFFAKVMAHKRGA